jgi:hypothetical protein
VAKRKSEADLEKNPVQLRVSTLFPNWAVFFIGFFSVPFKKLYFRLAISPMTRLGSKWTYKRRLLCRSRRFRPVYGKSRSPLFGTLPMCKRFPASGGVANPNWAMPDNPAVCPWSAFLSGKPPQKYAFAAIAASAEKPVLLPRFL